MKRLLLIMTTAFFAVTANAQCTPGANYADSTYGVWPDTIQNFPGAMQNVAYSTDLNFKVPSDAGDIDPNYAGFAIDHFVVNSVTGLPPGMSYTCNVSNCTYNGGTNGCAQITGTCATPGLYNITINLTATVMILGSPLDVPRTFTGYKIDVATLGISEIIAQSVELYPNPVLSELSLNGLKEHSIESIEIYDANGNKVQEMKTNAYDNIEMNVSQLNSGIYFVHLSGAEGIAVKKFIKR